MLGITSLLRTPIAWVGWAVSAGALLYGYRENRKQFEPAMPPLPSILRGATAGSGTRMSCDKLNVDKVAYSPEIMVRLRERFPPGSPAIGLEAYLKSEGFIVTSPCVTQDLIRMAQFNQVRGGGMSYPASATIWWKMNGTSLSWVTANIVYIGL